MSKAVTTKGYTVAGLDRAYNPRFNHWLEYSGRVRVIDSDPFFDEMVRWDKDGIAIDHGFGDLALASQTKQYQVKQGENIFRDLKG